MSLKRRRSTLQFAPSTSTTPSPFLIQPIAPAPSDVDYTLYSSLDGSQILAHSAPNVDYESAPIPPSSTAFYIGLLDNSTGLLTVAPAPLHVIKRELPLVSRLLEPTASSFIAARTDLGETFGNKKTRAQLKARERAIVDVSAMGEQREFIVGSVGAKNEVLPSKVDIKAAADGDRPIPPHNMDAVQPVDAYPAEYLLPKQIAAALSTTIKQLRSHTSHNTSIENVLPTKSRFFIDRVAKLLALDAAEGKPKARYNQLGLAVYMCYLRAFRDSARCSRSLFDTKLGGQTPKPVLDGIYETFTEISRTSTKKVHTAACESKLLSWLIVMLLHVDDFSTDVTGLAVDLSMAIPKLSEHFKSVGCKVSPGLLVEGSTTKKSLTKRAVLHTPLQFPEVRRKRASGR